METIKIENTRYFESKFCSRLMQAIPNRALYEGISKDEWLERLCQTVNTSLALTKDLTVEEQEQIDLLKWLKS